MAEGTAGYRGKVTLGASANTISLMGSWNMSGVTADLLETTAFGDDWKKYVPGLKDGGTVSFSGLYDGTDTNGQTALRNLNAANTSTTTLRLYINETSYYAPSTTNPLSFAYITSWDVGAEVAGLLTASFEAKVSGKMELI